MFVPKHSNNEGLTAIFPFHSLCYSAMLAYFNLITGFLSKKKKERESAPMSTFC